MQTKRNIFLWVLYDFANSIVAVIFFLYFAQWAVIDQKIPDLTFNLTFTVAAILLLLTVPFTGFWLDKFFRRISGLRITTVMTALLYSLCAMSALQNQTTSALIFFTIALYTYLLSFTFYTPLINDISLPAKRGTISGIGISANYLGQITGLLIALPFSLGALSFFDGAPRAETLLPATLLFFFLSLPMLIFFHEPKRPRLKLSWKNELSDFWQKTRELFVYPGVTLFILCYFFFNDAVLTASNNFPIFMEQVWGVSDTTKTYVLLGILVTSALGGTLAGLVADKYGHKKTLMVILVGWLIILPTIAMLTNFVLFTISTTLMGFWFGASWAVSRSVMSHLTPPNKHNLAFAYFGLVERASSFAGPIVWGLTLSSLTYMGPDRYRIATLAISLFIALGFYCLSKVKLAEKNS